MSIHRSDVRECLCLQSRRAARHLTQIYDHALRPSGLRITQFQLLAAIGEAEPVTQQTLADLMSIDRTTLTRNLALLQRDGLISIEQAREDRREHCHSLTNAGRDAINKSYPVWRSVQKRLAEQLSVKVGSPSKGDISQFLGALNQLAGGTAERK